MAAPNKSSVFEWAGLFRTVTFVCSRDKNGHALLDSGEPTDAEGVASPSMLFSSFLFGSGNVFVIVVAKFFVIVVAKFFVIVVAKFFVTFVADPS